VASLPKCSPPEPRAPSIAVEARGLGKRYGSSGAVRGQTLYERLAGRRAGAAAGHWALRNVSFSVPQGQVLGIVGRNGSGKTTLMRILARITSPTEGEARLRGRVGALLEIGSSFHPELTGRENIPFAGAILGMSAQEAARVTDEIIGFADIGTYIDEPVKQYSFGMYMRLAFAVAAHLENEILLLDEILAVGDEQFQEKCRARIAALCRVGRTVLIISHVTSLLKEATDSLLVMERGEIVYAGEPVAGVDYYHREVLPRGGHAANEGRL
jgi:ABC-type polysaccharide/polyol phosphate transport system ATPase subunit